MLNRAEDRHHSTTQLEKNHDELVGFNINGRLLCIE